MPGKGQIKTHSYYEKEDRYLKLLKEAYAHGEVSQEILPKALKIAGFSENTASAKAKEWSLNTTQLGFDSQGAASKRLKELASLEKYFNKNILGNAKYQELNKSNEINFIFS